MYKIVYCTDDGKRESTHIIDIKNYCDMWGKVQELIKDSSVLNIYILMQIGYVAALDIYTYSQIGYIDAYAERYRAAKDNLSSAYGMVCK